MVITMLYHRVKDLEHLEDLQLNDIEGEGDDANTSVNKKYLKGGYKVILQLCQLLDQGRRAKCLADRCIDACAHMQNLREAIYDHKIRLENPGMTPEQMLETESRGLHYLLRYFYLVVFAEYLLEEHPKLETSFLCWLEERREISNLTQKSNISFD